MIVAQRSEAVNLNSAQIVMNGLYLWDRTTPSLILFAHIIRLRPAFLGRICLISYTYTSNGATPSSLVLSAYDLLHANCGQLELLIDILQYIIMSILVATHVLSPVVIIEVVVLSRWISYSLHGSLVRQVVVLLQTELGALSVYEIIHLLRYRWVLVDLILFLVCSLHYTPSRRL